MRGVALRHGFLGILLLFAAQVAAQAETSATPKVGDVYEMVLIKDMETVGNGASGSSHDKDTVIERVIAVRSDGLELEYDLPKAVPKEQRAKAWQFPFRVFRPVGEQAQLLNGPELEARVDAWLKAANLSRTACGHWIFTWNAFRIECDPQSALKTAEHFDLRAAEIRDGASYNDAEAIGTGLLVKSPAGRAFSVELGVSPGAVRRARAESYVIVGEIMQKPVTLEDALGKHAADAVSGTILIVFETDSAGNVFRRMKTTKLDIQSPDGQSEVRTVIEKLERRMISPAH